MTRRREFPAQMSVAPAALAFDADEMRAWTVTVRAGPWDVSWIDRVVAAKYRVEFNASDVSYGAVVDYATTC